jgi:hypothetical protein
MCVCVPVYFVLIFRLYLSAQNEIVFLTRAAPVTRMLQSERFGETVRSCPVLPLLWSVRPLVLCGCGDTTRADCVTGEQRQVLEILIRHRIEVGPLASFCLR